MPQRISERLRKTARCRAGARAAAFWAARAHMQAGDPLRVITLLMAAAREEPTFYGMLAERMLGEILETGFTDPALTADNFLSLMQIPAAHRAVALWQLGRIDDVPNEMNRAFSAADYRSGAIFCRAGARMNLPDLELRASETAAARGMMLTGLFPCRAIRPMAAITSILRWCSPSHASKAASRPMRSRAPARAG